MGKLLISGNGKKNFAGVIVYATVFIIAVIAGLYFLISAGDLRKSDQDMFQIFGVVLLILGIGSIIPLLKGLFMSKTKIDVYENGIEGDALEGTFSLKNFKLTYNQILNVDIMKNIAVVLYTQHAKYTCYASNCAEIRDCISRLLSVEKQ